MSVSIGNYLGINEAAKIIGVKRERMYQFVDEGRFKKIVRESPLIFIDKKEVENFAKIPRPTGRPKKSQKKRK